MNQRIAKSNSSTEDSVMAAEIEALRKRLTALEESRPGYGSSRRRTRNVNSKVIVIGIFLATLAVVWIVSDRALVVQGQSGATDSLTIDRNGNVGIKTTTPSTTLDVNGDLKAKTGTIDGELKSASLRFPDGTTQVTAAPPSGAVIAFDLPGCPAGWTEYAQAYGRFIRGIDKSGRRTDPDGPRSAGSTQEDAIRNITGSIIGVKGAGNRAWDWGFRPGTNGAFDVPYSLDRYNPYGGGEYKPEGGVGWTANFDASRIVPTAAENRPRNVALLYCRKN